MEALSKPLLDNPSFVIKILSFKLIETPLIEGNAPLLNPVKVFVLTIKLGNALLVATMHGFFIQKILIKLVNVSTILEDKLVFKVSID